MARLAAVCSSGRMGAIVKRSRSPATSLPKLQPKWVKRVNAFTRRPHTSTHSMEESQRAKEKNTNPQGVSRSSIRKTLLHVPDMGAHIRQGLSYMLDVPTTPEGVTCAPLSRTTWYRQTDVAPLRTLNTNAGVGSTGAAVPGTAAVPCGRADSGRRGARSRTVHDHPGRRGPM